MMNTYTEFFNRTEVERGWVDYVFDPDSTSVNTGIVPEIFRQRKESIRSRHPTHSVAAMGKYADHLTRRHDARAAAYLPYAILSDIGGKYVAIGIGRSTRGASSLSPACDRALRHRSLGAGREVQEQRWTDKLFTLRDRGRCVTQLPVLVRDLRDQGVVQDGMVGAASAILVPARDSLQIMTAALTSHPERNLCDNVLCYWCRELERRMDLLQAVQNPRYFQKHAFAIRLITVMNQIRESDTRVVAWTKRLIKKRVRRRRPRVRSH